jgi:hypothetical protein
MIEQVPLWLVGPVLLGMFLLAVELGFRIRQRLDRRRAERKGHEKGGQEYLLSAVLGLLALLLGFTFSLGLSRYEARQDLVVQEANAIGTAWLRASLLEEPARTELRSQLKVYVEARLDWSRTGENDLVRTAELQADIWRVTGDALRADNSGPLSRAVMEAVNESFEMAAARQAAKAAHIPDRVLALLVLYAILSVLMLGYVAGASGGLHRGAILLLLIQLSLAIALILDIDRPGTGGILMTQQPIELLILSLR